MTVKNYPPGIVKFLICSLIFHVGLGFDPNPYLTRIVAIFAKNDTPNHFDNVGPALRLALEKARSNYPQIDFELVLRESTESCMKSNAAVLAAEEFYLKNVSAFIGPGCSLSLDQVSRMAAHWNVPVYTASGVEDSFTDKTVYSTLTRLSFSMDRVTDFFITILREFNWHHVSLLVDEQNQATGSSLKRALEKDLNYSFFVETIPLDNGNLTSILQWASSSSRVFVILSSIDVLWKIFLQGYDLGMGDGTYAFLTIEMIQEKTHNHQSISLENVSLLFNNYKLRRMYESLMLVSIRVPTSLFYSKFVKDMVNLTKDSNYPILEDDVTPSLSAFHDAILLYAWALNRTLAFNEDPKDGAHLARLTWNKTFVGVLPSAEELIGDIYMNENGDREADFTLSDFNSRTGLMIPVATYFGDRRVYERINNVSIHWPGDKNEPPLDVPICGFNGLSPRCKTFGTFPATVGVVIFVCFFLLLSGLMIMILIYRSVRKIKLEAELADVWWKVKYEDIVVLEESDYKSAESLSIDFSGEMVEKNSRTSIISSIPPNGNFTEIKIGIYKETKIVIKRVNMPIPSIRRPDLMELKQMKQISHENIVRFVGLCIDEPRVFLLSELCHRGSLQDLLAKESMQINWDFRYSMISDLVEGMAFLHNSFLSHHGRFKSTNCVVDGRFVVKITDYGLKSFRNQVLMDSSNYRSFLWCAPELLRTSRPFNHGSKKSDIYSFAIILQEIVTRTGPYEPSVVTSCKRLQPSLSPQYIVQRVKQNSLTPFRPDVGPNEGPTEVLELMRNCWAENPEDRPSFVGIKSEIKRITKGISNKNLLDRLLLRMEQYANNLESLVEEKTQSLIDEKKKTEQLLYQLLPKYIAEELKNGRPVKPESFDSVTVFFSDVVGFTPLAAESSPIEVVDLLNDLYSCFDSIIENYNVYKVETIGDAYMVVSGLPVKNGNNHAREIARMALSLLIAIDSFRIRHIKDRKLQLRIGIHSGPCAAGVVGLKMPKYCLFGDTVNTASRMETNGHAMKIHVSLDTKEILDSFGNFDLQLRGDVNIKGKGLMETYWLIGEKSQ